MDERDREQVARQILAQRVPCKEPWHGILPKPSCWQCARNGAFVRAARIVMKIGATDAAPLALKPRGSVTGMGD
jgi:hypothetical protein